MRCKLYALVVSVKPLFGPITFNDIVFCQCGSQSRPFFLVSRSSFIQSGERTLQRGGLLCLIAGRPQGFSVD